jgi:hypothetical protein
VWPTARGMNEKLVASPDALNVKEPVSRACPLRKFRCAFGMSALDKTSCLRNIRFTPESGHFGAQSKCPLRANSRHREFGSHQKKNPGTLPGAFFR